MLYRTSQLGSRGHFFCGGTHIISIAADNGLRALGASGCSYHVSMRAVCLRRDFRDQRALWSPNRE